LLTNLGHLPSQFIRANGIRLHYKECGAGGALLLLHGGFASLDAWARVCEPLAEHHRVILLDTRGHGLSSDGETPMTYRLFADDTAAFMDALGIPSACFAGHSDGGCTTLELAMRHPAKVEKMALLGTPYNITNYRPGILESFRAAEAEARGGFHQRMMRMWGHFPAMTLGGLSTNTRPALVLHAENEEFFDLSHSRDLAKALSGEVCVIPNSGHDALAANPVFVRGRLLDFFFGTP